MGADDYVVKPFAWPELVMGAAASAGRTATSPRRSRSATWRLIPQREDRKGGEGVETDGARYPLLEYLAHREEQVVSHTDIWEQLYGPRGRDDEHRADVYIGYLRNKIDRDQPAKLIHTRRAGVRPHHEPVIKTNVE